MARDSEKSFQEAVSNIYFDVDQNCYAKINVIDDPSKFYVEESFVELHEEVHPYIYYINTLERFQGVIILLLFQNMRSLLIFFRVIKSFKWLLSLLENWYVLMNVIINICISNKIQ